MTKVDKAEYIKEKIAVNSKLINKQVIVLNSGTSWVGEVLSVKDENTLIVKRAGGISVEVDLFDIRQF